MLIYFKHFRRFFSRKLGSSGFVQSRGFTLIELIVVSAIILIITAFTLFQQAKFNSATLLRSLTYSVALSVRQAQVYGTSVREFSPGVFAAGYGIYVPSAGISPSTYYIFSDLDGDGAYDVGEALPSFTLSKGYIISSLCAVSGGACSAPASLTILFRRPNPDACVSNNSDGACAVDASALYSAAYIQLRSAGNNETRSVKISDTGQIAVCAPNLAPPLC